GGDSVADREALAVVRRRLDLVDERDRIVFERDAAAAVVADQQLILADAEAAGPRARNERRGRRQERPVERMLVAQAIEETRAGGTRCTAVPDAEPSTSRRARGACGLGSPGRAPTCVDARAGRSDASRRTCCRERRSGSSATGSCDAMPSR
ncbi:MAG TPA: hypothetical protein VGC30_02385, partial [Dokdonella sp.]